MFTRASTDPASAAPSPPSRFAIFSTHIQSLPQRLVIADKHTSVCANSSNQAQSFECNGNVFCPRTTKRQSTTYAFMPLILSCVDCNPVQCCRRRWYMATDNDVAPYPDFSNIWTSSALRHLPTAPRGRRDDDPVVPHVVHRSRQSVRPPHHPVAPVIYKTT